MSDTLLDATMIIEATNRRLPAIQFIDALVAGDEAWTHAQVAAEALEGTRDSRELARLQRFLRRMRLLHANESDSHQALTYLARFHLSHNLGFGDCLIAATALRHTLPVATLNDRRLFKGLKVLRPY